MSLSVSALECQKFGHFLSVRFMEKKRQEVWKCIFKIPLIPTYDRPSLWRPGVFTLPGLISAATITFNPDDRN